MKGVTQVAVWICFLILLTQGCKDTASLDSIEISPSIANGSDTTGSDLYVCELSNGYRQFKVTGKYDDDDTEDLTDEVTWETDATDDSVLSDILLGRVYCNSDFGVIGVKATYKYDNGDSSESGTEDEDNVDLTDTITVDAI